MNVFEAVFVATPDDIERVRFEFIEEFGDRLWDEYIDHYLRIDRPGLLFSAVRTTYKYWVINQLADNEARRRREEYVLPAEFLAIDVAGPDEITECPRCGHKAQKIFMRTATSYGDSRTVCDVCHYDLFSKNLEAMTSEMNERIARIKQQLVAEKT